jgi:tetratricopeptide (TPR) repeat protein
MRIDHQAVRGLAKAYGAVAAVAAILFGPTVALAQSEKGPTQPDAGVEVRSQLGSYIAGRIARGQHDTRSAALFYERTLDRDPGNFALIEQSILMDATEGRFERAIDLSKRIVETQPAHRMARLVLGLDAAKAGRWEEANEHFAQSSSSPMGELTSALARAWCHLGQGDVKAANDVLDNVKQAEWAQFYVRYHKALINDLVGRRQESRAAYERVFRSESKVLRIALAYAHHASASGDQKLARSIIEEHIKKGSGTPHPSAKALGERLKTNERLNYLVETPLEGLSEIFYGLGEALTSEGNAGIGVGAVYLQMAIFLKPEQPFALAALAHAYEVMKRYDAAIATYDRIPRGTPLQSAIDIRKALNLNQLERVEEAKNLLEKLAAEDPTDLRPLDALGTIMRGHKRFQEAVDYYTRIINIIGAKVEKKHWTYFYARGTSYERLKRWPPAEADLQRALRLVPDQPLVLNYLGYSWVDQNRNLKQGLSLIEKAVNLKPDDGYIVDSLGWAHYKLGNYKEAVKWLERAVELKPEDPVLNDHLGDAFWRVDRKLEARFQWDQALTLKPEPEDAEKIRKKLQRGLPAKPQPRTVKRGKDPQRAEQPRKQTRLAPQRPVVQ